MQELDALGAPTCETLALASLSDPGRVRTENQDAIAVLENTNRERLVLVADGMGGHRGGETASRICLQIVERVFREPHGTPEERLRRGLELANEEIYSHALANPELRGMGTTAVVALLPPEGAACIAWVGDSRCYRLRDGSLEPLTRDHSLMAEWISIGVISAEAAETHPRRHELTRALGQTPDVAVDLVAIEVRPGDRLLLCSDGLHGCVPERALKQALGQGAPEAAARALVDAANASGGHDNISVVVAALPAAPKVVAAELDPASAPAAEPASAFEPAPEIAPEPALPPPEPPALEGPQPDISFADLGAEIAEEVAETPLAAAAVVELSTAPPPIPEPEPEFLPPSAQRIEIPLMIPVHVRRGLDTTSVIAGIAATLVIVGLCFGAWLYTGSRSRPERSAAAPPRSVVVQRAPVAPAREPGPALQPVPKPPPVVKPESVVRPESAGVPERVAVPETSPETVPPRPADPPAREPIRVASPEPRAVKAPASVPAAPETTGADPAPASIAFELTPEVRRFADDWLRALATHDHALLESLGFPAEPAAFAGSAGTRDGFRLVAADIDEERSQPGLVYLRVVVSYAFRDATGRFRTQDEQRLILRNVGGRLRFEGRWRQ